MYIFISLQFKIILYHIFLDKNFLLKYFQLLFLGVIILINKIIR